MKLLASSVLLVSLLHGLFAAKFSGNVKLNNGFGFLGKFCFQYEDDMDTTAGKIDATMTHEGTHSTNWSLILYDDEPTSFYGIYKSDLTCREKSNLNSTYPRLIVPFSWDSHKDYEKTMYIHQHIRPRFWWAYVVNCDEQLSGASGIGKVSFDMHFTQSHVSAWNKELGSDERGLNTMYIFYLFVYIIMFAIQFYGYHVYRIQQYVHQVIKLLTGAVFIQLFSVLFNFVDYMIYTESGEHELFFEIAAVACEALSTSVFLLLLLVLAQGWTISHFEVRYPKTLLLFVFLVFALQLSFFVWRVVGYNDESTRYFYDSTPQWCYGGLMIALGVMFAATCIHSYINEPLDSKRSLYLTVGGFFFFWFLVPLLRIVVAGAFNDWVRDVSMASIEMTWDTITFAVMIGLMWPTWAHQYFNLSMGDTQERILAGTTEDNVAAAGKTQSYKQLDEERL